MASDSLPPKTTPIENTERVALLDALRGIALFGVLTVNLLTLFRVSLVRWLNEFHTHPGALNEAIDWIVGFAIESKAFSLFSLLFGVGIAVQAERSRHQHLHAFLLRRFLVLFFFGLVHLLFLWNGDILTAYAVCGVCLLPLVTKSARVLLFCAIAFLTLASLPLPFPDVIPHGAAARRWSAHAEANYRSLGFFSLLSFRWEESRTLILPLIATTLPRTLGLFALGMSAWKSGLCTAPAPHLRFLRVLSIVGIALGFSFEALRAHSAMKGYTLGRLNNFAMTMGIAGTALGYAALLILLLRERNNNTIVAHVRSLGRMALTNYLSQSVVLGFVFYGYGLGLMGRLAPAEAMLLVLALYLAQVIASERWLRRFHFGPMEWLWRSLSYGTRQRWRV